MLIAIVASFIFICAVLYKPPVDPTTGVKPPPIVTAPMTEMEKYQLVCRYIHTEAAHKPLAEWTPLNLELLQACKAAGL